MNKTIKQTLKAEWFLAKIMFKTDAILGVIYWLLVAIKYAIPLVSVWLWKMILDELTIIYQTKTENHIVFVWLSIYLSIQILSSFIDQMSSVFYQKIKRKASYNFDIAIMQKMAEIDVAFFDDPNNRDATNAAQTSETHIVDNIPWAVDTVVRIISFVSGLIVFLSYDWLVGIIFMSTYIPGAIISYKQKKKVDQWSIDNIPENRKRNYYKSLLTRRFAAKDLRLYNLSDYFKQKYNGLLNKVRNERSKLFVKGSIASFLASLLTYSGIVVIVLLSVRSVIIGTMAIGTLALYIGLAKTNGTNFGIIINDLACQIEIDVPHVIQYINFIKYENEIKDNGTEEINQTPEIEFDNVCFKYPGSRDYVLKDLSFKIEKGKKIALIGVNGAGKTTIIKLLLRFYEPESGKILLDGKSICDYPLSEVHKIFGVCFQDINRYSLTARENIAIADIDRKEDTDAINFAAVATGADEIISNLNCGLETDMTRQFNNNGAELSGGQWQKIALSRAFFRRSRFIILDEPSSALDPEAEDYIFSSFKRLCQNKGGILISHRLSSIMMVDKVVLIENGTVVESGTHKELINKNGRYAEMYHMQAEKYVGVSGDE